MAFGVGLPAFVLVKVLSPAYFAREDTATPMWFAGAGMVVNVAGAVVLAMLLAERGIAHVGIAAATSLAGWLNAGLLFAGLVRRRTFRADRALARRLVAIALASLAMGGALLPLGALVEGLIASDALAARVAGLAVLVIGGGVLFFGLCQASGAIDLRRYARTLTKRGAPAA
jgi:putative peptidoglycan lipid II flippase